MAKNPPVELKAEVKPEPQYADFFLTVRNPFGDYQKGQRINDLAEIEAITNSNNLHNCNKSFKGN